MSEKRLSFSFKRNDVCLLMDGLESVIQDITNYEGGIYTEEYVILLERLKQRLRDHDLGRQRTPKR